MSIDIGPALAYLSTEHGTAPVYEHTGGGNWVVGLGTCHGYDEEQGAYRYDVNVGPVYREADGWFTGEAGDLYAVSIHPDRDDVVIHTGRLLLPVLLSMLGIEDVNVDDPTVSLDEIAAALGDGWTVGCLGGNIYGVCTRDGSTMITVDHGQNITWAPASIIIGRQGPDDEEWSELWSGTVWDADELPAIVADHVDPPTDSLRSPVVRRTVSVTFTAEVPADEWATEYGIPLGDVPADVTEWLSNATRTVLTEMPGGANSLRIIKIASTIDSKEL